ncbi:aliphatic sulfonate ABC transporter substrate-binding protein [Pendulispora albinea]|uniref:Aliphatic sulfonate ABC transporter substrate-binding protein n=1 Tax=Pendulispora albinea TaxID=2741071 RepID=A0ABZ2LUM0_9BACT
MANDAARARRPTRRQGLLWALGAMGTVSVAAACRSQARSARPRLPEELRVDWAYYSPLSMVVRQKQWLEERFATAGAKVPIRWILSLGSNKALELLGSGALDIGSTAGGAALLSRANGNAIRAVYIFSKPEWTALVVPKASSVRNVADLRGKKIAATKGTDPYLFLLRVLHDAGLTKRDVELVHLQHPDGRAALERGDVDAWAGLDPHMAASELEQGSRLVVRKPEYNTYGFLDVRDAFAEQYPDAVRAVIEIYERARRWALANPDELRSLVTNEAKLSPAVTQRVLERNDFGEPRLGAAHVNALRAVSSILVDEQLVRAGADVGKAVDTLLDTKSAEGIAG